MASKQLLDKDDERKTTNQRVAFDDDDDGLFPPQQSKHWESLVHEDGDVWIGTLEELQVRFRSDLASSSGIGGIMALWSCVVGYCEALSTHKEATSRYKIFPVPITALERLIETEFRSGILKRATDAVQSATSVPATITPEAVAALVQQNHRATVRAVANAVWDAAISSKKKDEEHANSLYVCLRGKIDQKSIDCLGSSVTTVAGMKILQESNGVWEQYGPYRAKTTSVLTLSEDHAYETHTIDVEDDTTKNCCTRKGTCEVAIPGSTQKQKAKRACEIGDTFREKYASELLRPESSWLYMATNAVACRSLGESLVPIVANINCTIRSKPPGSSSNNSKASLESRQLYRLKRELLWSLYDHGAMTKFPFGLMELGDCEQTLGSKRGEEWILSKHTPHKEPILKNEDLFLEAIHVSKTVFGDAQVYPYYYAGHYHKDAGETQVVVEDNSSAAADDDHEHRFVEALEFYAKAAATTSNYRFDTGDCLPLNKHVASVAALIQEDILLSEGENATPRIWKSDQNALQACQQLLKWMDHLLYWEESSLRTTSRAGLVSKNPRFVSVLQPSHKFFVGKLLQTFSQDCRSRAIDELFSSTSVRSHRLVSPTTLLAKAVVQAKVRIKDLDLAIVEQDDDDDGGGRRRKRTRRR